MLYEVITHPFRVLVGAHHAHDDRHVTVILATQLGALAAEHAGLRITSYNVCYTKLLRTLQFAVNQQDYYAIHYSNNLLIDQLLAKIEVRKKFEDQLAQNRNNFV